jgi:hypothetical protein
VGRGLQVDRPGFGGPRLHCELPSGKKLIEVDGVYHVAALCRFRNDKVVSNARRFKLR